MTLLKTYQLSVITSCVLFVAFWFAPWLHGYLDPEIQSLLSWGAYKATFNIPEWFWNGYLILIVISYVGMFLLRKAFRTLFLAVIVISFLIASINGMSVLTGVEVIMIDLSTLLSGFVIALAYYSDLKDKFY